MQKINNMRSLEMKMYVQWKKNNKLGVEGNRQNVLFSYVYIDIFNAKQGKTFRGLKSAFLSFPYQ